jgi:hypothetical protein
MCQPAYLREDAGHHGPDTWHGEHLVDAELHLSQPRNI